MDELERLLAKADFSKETTQKNQLYYELFRKPVPVFETLEPLLSDADLRFVNGGVSRSMPEEQKQVTDPAETGNAGMPADRKR